MLTYRKCFLFDLKISCPHSYPIFRHFVDFVQILNQSMSSFIFLDGDGERKEEREMLWQVD